MLSMPLLGARAAAVKGGWVGSASWVAGSLATNSAAAAAIVAALAAVLTYLSIRAGGVRSRRHDEIVAEQTKKDLEDETQRADRAEHERDDYQRRYFDLLERLTGKREDR